MGEGSLHVYVCVSLQKKNYVIWHLNFRECFQVPVINSDPTILHAIENCYSRGRHLLETVVHLFNFSENRQQIFKNNFTVNILFRI